MYRRYRYNISTITYGLILDTNNQLNDEEQKRQKYKFYALRILVLVHIIRCIYFHLVVKNGKVPISYLDLTQYFEFLPEFSRFKSLMASVLVFETINLFNRIYTKYSEFFAIIKVLKGSESGIRDEKTMTDFVKIKIVKRIIDLAVAINNIAFTFLAINSVFVYYYPNHILEATFSSSLFLFWGYVVE